MTQADIQVQVLETLTGLKNELKHLKKDVHQIMEFLEDGKLSSHEKDLIESSMLKVRDSDESDFESEEDVKEKLDI